MPRRIIDALEHWRERGTIGLADYATGLRIRDVWAASKMPVIGPHGVVRVES